MFCCVHRHAEIEWAFTPSYWKWSNVTIVGQPVAEAHPIPSRGGVHNKLSVPSQHEGEDASKSLAVLSQDKEAIVNKKMTVQVNIVPDSDNETCSVCGGARPMLINETWAGQLHSACSHGACESCLARWVVSELPRCRAERMLRVRCIDKKCSKVMPQPLVHHALFVAQVPSCIPVLLDGEMDFHMCIFGPRNEQPPMGPHVCSICCEFAGHLLKNFGCEHSACSSCWQRWIEAQIPSCRAKCEMPEVVKCFVPECGAEMAAPLWRHVCSESSEGSLLLDELATRSRLQKNLMFPREMQVNCPRPGCVGLGYLGFDQVMCFICEHQWISNGSMPGDEIPSGVIKACPKCHVNIEKTGGCDHMTCSQCRHEFSWTTLANYRQG